MRFTKKIKLLALLFCLLNVANLFAVTTVPVKVKCPVCGVVNDFYDYASWGSYVYQWPSKFQMVFWPHTYPTSLYICKHCHFAAWMWDFKDLKPEKIGAVRAALTDIVSVPNTEKYLEVPMSIRLSIAERVYQKLDKDDEFWGIFYRVQGYHLAREHKADEAQRARVKAQQFLAKLSAEPNLRAVRKEHLVSLAAMQHFAGDDQAALASLDQAAKETYSQGENASGFNEYLTALIKEYREKIISKSVPADAGGKEEQD